MLIADWVLNIDPCS
jgi:hypothetical protein